MNIGQNEFHFDVFDDEGFWGGVRVVAADASVAEAKCRAFLAEEFAEPNGSLGSDFELRPREAGSTAAAPNAGEPGGLT